MAILILINLAIQDFSRIHYIYIDFVGIYIRKGWESGIQDDV
jgi:hypothetical protein